MLNFVKTSSRIMRMSIVLAIIAAGFAVNAYATENPDAFNGAGEYQGMGSTIPEKIGDNQYRIQYGIDFKNESPSTKYFSAYFLFRYAPGIKIDSFDLEPINGAPAMPNQNVYFRFEPESNWMPVTVSPGISKQISDLNPTSPIMVNLDGGASIRPPALMGTIASGTSYRYQITVEATTTSVLRASAQGCSPFQDQTEGFTLHRGVLMSDNSAAVSSYGVSHVISGVCRPSPSNVSTPVTEAPSVTNPVATDPPQITSPTPTSPPATSPQVSTPVPSDPTTPSPEYIPKAAKTPLIELGNQARSGADQNGNSKFNDTKLDTSLGQLKDAHQNTKQGTAGPKSDVGSGTTPQETVLTNGSKVSSVQSRNLYNGDIQNAIVEKASAPQVSKSDLYGNSENHKQKELSVSIFLLMGMASACCFAVGLRKNMKAKRFVSKEEFVREGKVSVVESLPVFGGFGQHEVQYIDVYGAHESAKAKARAKASMPMARTISSVASQPRILKSDGSVSRFDLPMRIFNELFKRTTKQKELVRR